MTVDYFRDRADEPGAPNSEANKAVGGRPTFAPTGTRA